MQLPVRNLLECAKDLFLLASILKVRILEGSRVLDSGGNELDKFPSAMGTVTRLACELARQQGVETESLLRKAGLTSQQVDNPRSRLAVASQINFLDLAATALNDDCLGFHLAQHFDLRSAGLFYYVLASSDTLGEALQRGVRYSAIVNEGIRLRLRDGECIEISFEYVGTPRHSDRHQIEFSMATLLRLCRHLTKRNLQASRVSFLHHRRDEASEIRAFFGSEVVFGSAEDEIALPTSIKHLAIVDADPYLNELLIKYCEEALAERSVKRSSFGLNVEKIIARRLPHGKARADEIARELCVSRRTLARRLATEGLTLGGVIQQLRAGLAKRHLADETMSVSEIAWLLGYRDVSAFTHAFRRWTGRSPRELRHELR